MANEVKSATVRIYSLFDTELNFLDMNELNVEARNGHIWASCRVRDIHREFDFAATANRRAQAQAIQSGIAAWAA